MVQIRTILVAFFLLNTSLTFAQTPLFNVERDILKVLTHFDEADERPRFELETKQLPVVETDTHTNLNFIFKSHKLTLQLLYDAEALANPKLLLPDAVFFGCLKFPGCIEMKGIENNTTGLIQELGSTTSVYAMSELFYDAKNDDPSAQARLLRWRIELLKQMSVTNEFEEQFPGTRSYLEELLNIKEKQLKETLAKAISSERNNLEEFTQNQAMNTDSFEELRLSNDRAGVAKYLRNILPWKLMQKAEINAWNLWIEAIEHPDPTSTVLAFRGISHKEIGMSKDSAQGKVKIFLSPFLNRDFEKIDKNIRDYPKKRISFGDREQTKITASGVESVAKITDMMHSHSEADSGLSIFLSLSPDFNVAESFVSGGQRIEGPAGSLLAVRIDKRRLFPNIATGFPKEFEFLAPLIIFPDEILIYRENYDSSEESRNSFLKELETLGEDVDKNLERYYDGNMYKIGFDYLKGILKE